MNTLPPIPFNNPAKPILLESLVMREQCWAQLLDKYEPSLANLIIACNDALYRYDIFTEMPFAYDMELYDEYMNEAVALALKLSQSLTFLDKQKKDFTIVLDIVDTTEEVYTRKIEQIILEIKNQVSQQVQKMFTILVIIIILSIISFLVKLTLRKYFSQNENFYMINKSHKCLKYLRYTKKDF